MAKIQNQCWVTSVTNDAAVVNALVLLESIRRTKSSRIVVVITSVHVSMRMRCLLRQTFDGVYVMEEVLSESMVCVEALAKAYAFTMVPFQKCVFVSSSSFFLENADKLFETGDNYCQPMSPKYYPSNLSTFIFNPSKDAWISIWKHVNLNEKEFSEEHLAAWLQNQGSLLKFGVIEENMVSNFCVANGALLSHFTHTPIVLLINGHQKEFTLSENMQRLKYKDMDMREKQIINTWLNLEDNVSRRISSDMENLYPAPTCDNFGRIAIIGMSCRYPKAGNLEEFWNLLYSGEEGIQQAPEFRWTKEQSLDNSAEKRKSRAGFLSVPVDKFDAAFFGISPMEAMYLDPQTRLLHEVMWEALEDSAMDPHSLYGTHAGIFTGSWMQDYKDIVQCSAEKDFFRTYMGNSIGAAAARLSRFLGFTGPSIATESGCSSSIVALDLAVKSLRARETNLALAGGVNLLLHPFDSSIMEHVISPDGRCKTFDANADGFGRAEGCGVLVLKRLDDAMRDRDHIWAVIRGSAVSQEGTSRSLGTPTVHCEALAMKLALEDANVTPEQISFLETHGTGTQVGDPLEVAAIAKAYYSPKRKEPLVIGSVKTNVGHTESCSGITGIMKAVLALQHEIIPRHKNMETLNPEIFLDSIPAIIPMENLPWPRVEEVSRLCGVSSFGITGTDSHVILEEAPEYKLPKFTLGLERHVHLMTISGKTSDALEELLGEYENQFFEHAGTDTANLGNMAYSANVGRAAFNHRTFLVASSFKEAGQILKEKSYLRGEVKEGHNSQICFLFTGQGSQYQGMAKVLYETSPIFRINFDACERTLRENYNLSIREVLWESEPSSKELSRTIYSQTSIFCVEYCLLKLWQSWGIKPHYVLGHSLGEFCAAVAAGVLTFEDALKLVAERSRLIDNLPRGSMLVIKASEPDVKKWMKSVKIDLDFAAVNYPEQTVVAGDTKTVENFLAYLKVQGTKAIILEATHAFHSRHMYPMLERYQKVTQSIKYKMENPSIQYVSGMEGRLIDDVTELGPDYWVRHTREKVSFIDACAVLRDLGCQDFLEIGPQPVLSSFVLSNNEGASLNCLPSLRRGTNDWETILTSLGKLYLLGYQVDWKGYDETYIRKKVSLPFHPFHRKSFWVECTSNQTTIIHPLVGCSMKNASALSIFQNDVTFKTVPYLKDHCIGSRVIFPGAAYTEMCLSAGYCVANDLSKSVEPFQPSRAMRLENTRIEAPLELKEGKSCRFQVIVDLPESGKSNPGSSTENQGFSVKVFHQNHASEEASKWVLHATATYFPVASTKESMKLWQPDRMREIISTGEYFTPEQFYKRVDETGLRFGETFKSISNYWAVKQSNCKKEVDEIVVRIPLPKDANKYLLHPLLIDAGFQSGLLTRMRYEESKLKVPVRIGSLSFFPQSTAQEIDASFIYLHCWTQGDECVVFSATSDFRPIALVENVELIDTNVPTIEAILESSAVPDAWEETWKSLPTPFTTAALKPVDINSILDQVVSLSCTEEEVNLHRETERLLYLYIVDALHQLGWQPSLGEALDPKSFCARLGIQSGFEKLVRFYFTVLQEQDGIFRETPPNSNHWTVSKIPPHNAGTQSKQLCQRLKATCAVAPVINIYEHIATSLPNILTGKESALDILFPQSSNLQHLSADSYYQNHPGRHNTVTTIKNMVDPCIKQSHVLNGSDSQTIFRCLEVGGGSCSMSLELAKRLRQSWGQRFELYFTDISQSFFIRAEKVLEDYKENVKFAVFNIEESPLSQGIPLGYFDCVCATDVLHATRNLEETLVHLRQTMKPGGVLLFTETVRPSVGFTFVFGLLEGYWRFEDFNRRPHHCCVGAQCWADTLKETGFENVKFLPSYLHDVGVVMAAARLDVQVDQLMPPKRRGVEKRKEWVLFLTWASVKPMLRVAHMLNSSGYRVTTVWKREEGAALGLRKEIERKMVTAGIEDSAEIEGVLGGDKLHGVIYAWGMNKEVRDQRQLSLPFLHIAKFVAGMIKPPQLFVVTEGMQAVTEDTVICNPGSATLFGMVKSLKNENFDMMVRCVDLDKNTEPDVKASQVLFELVKIKGNKEQHRVQVAYRGGVRYEPRMVKAALVTREQALMLPPSTDRFHLKLPATRLIQDLEFEPLEAEPVGETEVEVKTQAFSLNFKDILTILKPNAEFEKLNAVGLDFSGVVTKVGTGSKWKVGDRVFGCNYKDEQLPSHLVMDSKSVTGIPENMTYWEAATLPAVFSTAYHCLINIAKMKKGDRVLIHTGSGGVGLAAIQLAEMVGAEIITTAGNPRKRAYLRSLGVQHVFHSRDTSFEPDILRVTNGQGVDIVLNSITGPGIKEATLRATAKNGRFVEMSKLNIWTSEEVTELRPDVEYNIVDLTKVDQESSISLLKHLRRLLSARLLKSIPFVKFDALYIRQALQYFQKAKQIGKVVVAMPEVRIQQSQYITEVPLFNSQSSYLITGGLGGIGFEVCKWMLNKGATDIMLTGRSPPTPERTAEIEFLRGKGFNIVIRLGDVGKLTHCENMVTEISTRMKPLRGVMHCAGVLKDGLYANQTWSDFEATFTPKVSGTWHLHNLTRELPLEHFVVYSSIIALVGTPGQANHSAASCFEDAFIHYRHSLGLQGTTVNWGQWAQVGCAKEAYLSGVLPVSVSRMLNGLEVTLRSQKRQVCFSEFDSFANFCTFCPSVKAYLDDRLWKQYSGSGQGQDNQGSFNADDFWKEMDSAPSRSEKENWLRNYLKTILRRALCLENDEPLSDEANLQELGVDSLMFIELKNSIQSLLGSRVTVTSNMLKNCNTIGELATVVIGEIMEESDGPKGGEEPASEPLPEAELLELLLEDSKLTEDIVVDQDTNPAVRPSDVRTILVTGATGQLAPYLVSTLAKSYFQVQKILCLVRGNKDRLEKTLKLLELDEALASGKVEAVVGDITQKNLSLRGEQYAELCTNVDAVIHCAAKTNPAEHLRMPGPEVKNRTDCRSVNVEGTVNILRFCCTGKVKHLFYSSTLVSGVLGEDSHDQLSDNWPLTEIFHTVVISSIPGVQTSKWICEMLLHQANLKGIPCKVIRLPWIAGESQTGRLSLQNNLYILRFLTFLKLGAMLDLVIPANILPVDICAELALRLFLNDQTPNEIFNLCHPHPQVEQEFVQVAKQVLNKHVDILEWNQFTERIESQSADISKDGTGLGSILRDQKMISYYLADGVGLMTNYLKNPEGYFINQKVSKYLPNFEKNLPEAMNTLAKDLTFLKSSCLLEKVGL